MTDLLQTGNGPDRAFIDGVLRLRWARAVNARERDAISALHGLLQREATLAHRELRTKIACAELRGAALAECFEAAPAAEREHFTEEVLGIAYPPLDEPELERELVGYRASSLEELRFAFEAVDLRVGQRFLDIGSGMGKAVLLAELLCGARACGIEHDEALASRSERARVALGCGGSRFIHADVRSVELPEADVVFMYLPFSGRVLEGELRRLLRPSQVPGDAPTRFLCCGALDSRVYPGLRQVGPARSWLHIYAWR